MANHSYILTVMRKTTTLSALITLGLMLSSFLSSAFACTTAVISGKFTKSGRPMIWKLRDTEAFANHIRRFESPLGFFVGLVNDEDTSGEAVWGGHNSSGFAIMNSASFNVNENDTADIADQEGLIMKRALAECRTLADFEKLLDSLPKPMGLAAHFGVIDAEGGAAFYEVNNHSWTKFDANQDPRGYILRTNYSSTGTKDVGYGYVRFRTASRLFEGVKSGEMTALLLGSDFSRSMLNSQLGVDFREMAEKGMLHSDFIDSDDLITRYDTSSMILVEGVKPGEDPALACSWVQIGNPYISPLLPVWTREEVPEALALPASPEAGTISQKSLSLKKLLYPLTTVEESRYLFIPLILTPEGTGLSQRLMALEAQYIPEIVNAASDGDRTRLRDALLKESIRLMDSYLR